MENLQIFKDYPDVVTVSQLKDMLQIGINQAYSLIKTGVIPSIRIGREYKIAKISIINYVLYNWLLI